MSEQVGGFSTVDKFLHEYIIPDLQAATEAGADYLPVLFPGGSAHYEPRNPVQPFNRCPRDGGRFLWRQLANALTVAGVDMLCRHRSINIDTVLLNILRWPGFTLRV